MVKSLVIYRASGTSVLASGSSTSWWSEQYRGGRSLPSHSGVKTPHNGVEVGHSGNTPDAQTSTSVDAGLAPGDNKVGDEASSVVLEQTEEQAFVNVVTRTGWIL